MKVSDFIVCLEDRPEEFSWYVDDMSHEVHVKNDRLDTITTFTFDAIENHDWDFLERMTWHGKNVEHMTRVTGYFSKVRGWNAGKKAELNDRRRARSGEV